MPTDEEVQQLKRGGVDDWDETASSVTLWSKADSYEPHPELSKLTQELQNSGEQSEWGSRDALQVSEEYY